MSYPQLATWLTAQGYPTKADEVKNAKRFTLVEGVVPDSPQLRALLDTLKAQFPALEVEQFLVRPIGSWPANLKWLLLPHAVWSAWGFFID